MRCVAALVRALSPSILFVRELVVADWNVPAAKTEPYIEKYH